MGDSHYKSNLKGKLGTETISEFASITVPSVVGSTYLKAGTKYILTTTFSTAASINAEATNAVGGGTVPKGSIALGAGEFWLFTADNVASRLAQP